MKQPKKRWAWTAQQRGRCHHRHDLRQSAPAASFLRQCWQQHRAHTRQILHALLRGADEGHVSFLYQPRHSGWWSWS